jgi:hypothetical protein
MALSFLHKLFGQKKSGGDAGSLSIGETVKSVFKRETPASDTADQEHRKPIKSGPTAESTGAMTNANSLFAFVDPKDPFTPGEIAGEQLPGPIQRKRSANGLERLANNPRPCDAG